MSCSQGQQARAFVPADGHWWVAATHDQRDGFVVGEDECRVALFHRAEPSITRTTFEAAITNYFQRHPGRLNTRLAVLMARLVQHWASTGTYRFRVLPPAYADRGEMWRESPPSSQDGIIRGFLSCQIAEGGDRVTVPVSELVRRVSRWYGTEIPNEGDTLNPARANDRLYEVILQAETK